MRARPAVATIKFKRDAVNTKLVPKGKQKEDFKNFKAFYYHETGHAIDFENTQIIAEEKHTGKG